MTFIESEILKICNSPSSFGDISKSAYGTDLNELSQILTEMIGKGKLHKNQYGLYSTSNTVSKSYEKPNFNVSVGDDFLHLRKPHPLDFEWRNSKTSLAFLCSLIAKKSKILLLGMPTFFLHLARTGNENETLLLDKNRIILEDLEPFKTSIHRTLYCDIFENTPPETKFDTVFMDPPWYQDAFMSFMWFAAASLNLGGTVVSVLPPINTRPTIMQERIEFFDFCNKIGLSLEQLSFKSVEYISPFFEFNAYKKLDDNLMPCWRRGDLAIFRKVEEKTASRPSICFFDNADWQEFEVNDVRFRINLNSCQSEEISNINIKSLVSGDILNSVSNRVPIRKKANFWTSGNRLFYVYNSHVFKDVLGKNLKTKDLNLLEKNTRTFIQELVEVENSEYGEYLTWLGV